MGQDPPLAMHPLAAEAGAAAIRPGVRRWKQGRGRRVRVIVRALQLSLRALAPSAIRCQLEVGFVDKGPINF